jgi:hypothetical protein
VSPEALDAMVANRPALRHRVEGIAPWVARNYEVLDRDNTGTWYVRRDFAIRP